MGKGGRGAGGLTRSWSQERLPVKSSAVNCPSTCDQDCARSLQLDTRGKRFKFQLFATAVMIKKVHEGQHSDIVVLVTCLLTSIIQDQVKGRKSLGTDCAAIKDVKDLTNERCERQNTSAMCITKTKVSTCNLLSCLFMFFS